MPRDKQERIARETMEIYAPLANRLGIQWMKVELEDLAFQYLDPAEHGQLVARLAETAGSRESYITEVVERLKTVLAEGEIKAQVYGRAKHLWSIYQKMKKTGRDVEQIYDVLAFRVITESVRDCYAVLGVVHSNWTPVPGRFKDFIALPKPNLYQSLHTTVIGPRAERMEVQIRTQEMHRIAEQGIAAHWKYKEQKTPGADDGKAFAWLRQLMEWQRDLKDPTEFIETVKIDLFQDEVFVFTPKGDVKALPKGVDADRSRLRHPLAGRRALLGRARERPHRAAALRAPQRRHRGDPRLGQPEALQGLAQVRHHQPRPHQDPPLHPDGAARAQPPDGARSSGARAAQAGRLAGLRRARGAARGGGAAAAARHRRRSAGGGRLRQGQPGARRRRRPRSIASSTESPRRPYRPPRSRPPHAARSPSARSAASRSRGRPTSWSSSPSAARRSPATQSSGSSAAATASSSTPASARRRSISIRCAGSTSAGTTNRRRSARSRSRSPARTARACWPPSPSRSPSTGSTSRRRGAGPPRTAGR